MTLPRCFFLLLFLSLALFPIGSAAQDDLHRKKFIELGWDIPNTAYLKEHHDEMQRTTPFDGVMLALEATAPNGKRHSSQSMMDTQPWEPAWFAAAVEDLKACRWTTFTDNFLRFNFTPGQIDWHDDNGWTIFCNKTALCAKIAQETGLKGFAVDFEPYGKEVFKYAADSKHSFDEMKQIVRQRGKQWMEAIAAEYPDMVLLTLFIGEANIQLHSPVKYDYTDNSLQPFQYGLLPAFFNGMLDAVPPKMRIVDGCESGYYKNGIYEFAHHALAIKSINGPAVQLVAPENRQKYISQVQIGFGFYLDMYANPPEHFYYRGPKEGGTRLDRLEENLTAAWETTDEYVWIYGEQRRWWKPVNPDEKWEHWEEAMPGMSQTIQFAKDPWEAVKAKLKELKKEDRAVNLLQNPDFAESMENWTYWQGTPLGTCSWDDGSVKVSRAQWGCFLQNVYPVKPGEYYYVAIDYKQEGAGHVDMRILWKNTENKTIRESEARVFGFETEPECLDGRSLAEGWSRAEGIIRVLDGASGLQVLLTIRDQPTDADAVWLDNAVVIRLR